MASAWIFGPSAASAAALAVLGVGDPAAGLVGRRWGRRQLAGGRTLEGTLAFALFGSLAAFAVLLLWHGAAPMPALIAVSVAAGAAGAVAEAASVRIDDNLSVPLAAAVAAALTGSVLGLRI